MRRASHLPWLPMAHASSLFLRDRCACISDRYPPIWWPKAACTKSTKRLGWSFAFASHGFDGAWWHPSKPSQPMGCSADAGDVRVVSPSALSHLQGPDHPLGACVAPNADCCWTEWASMPRTCSTSSDSISTNCCAFGQVSQHGRLLSSMSWHIFIRKVWDRRLWMESSLVSFFSWDEMDLTLLLFPTCQVRVVRFYVSCLLLSSSPLLLLLLNHDPRRTVFSVGPQPRPSTPSVPCRTSTTTIPAQCSLPDLNPRPSTPSVPCRTSTASIHAKCSLPDLM